jgi:hypothetical protein
MSRKLLVFRNLLENYHARYCMNNHTIPQKGQWNDKKNENKNR